MYDDDDDGISGNDDDDDDGIGNGNNDDDDDGLGDNDDGIAGNQDNDDNGNGDNDDGVSGNGNTIAPSSLPAAIQNYIATNYPTATITKAEQYTSRYEVNLSTGIELYFDLNGNLLGTSGNNGGDDDDDGPSDDDDDGSAASNSGAPTHREQPQKKADPPKKNEPAKPSAKDRVEATKKHIDILEALPKRDKATKGELVWAYAVVLGEGDDKKAHKFLESFTSFEDKDGNIVTGTSDYGRFKAMSEKRINMTYLKAGQFFWQSIHGDKLKAVAEELRKATGNGFALEAIMNNEEYENVEQIRKGADVKRIGKSIKLAIEIAESYSNAKPDLLEESLAANNMALHPFDFSWSEGTAKVTEEWTAIMQTMNELTNQDAAAE